MNPNYYFAYGSNIWLEQMRYRCPASEFVDIGILSDWQWFISGRGYANVRRSAGDVVYGFVYTLTPNDEEILDGIEGVPKQHYQKQLLNIDLMGKRVSIKGLVYVDDLRMTDGVVKEEYIARMNYAIKDAEEKGIPKEYFEKYWRPFVPNVIAVHGEGCLNLVGPYP
jgi:gamma-glutamylcyclotransferase